jgi:hypothetical protein
MDLNPLPLPLAIDVPLREKRTYVQSASLFNFLIAKTGVDRNISLSFRRKIECEIEALSADANSAESSPARFAGENGRARFDLVMVEKQPLKRLERRESYDEAAVVADSRIEGTVIFSASGNGASAIDRMVALNKRLILQTTAPQKVLIFSKIFLSTLPGDRAPLTVALKSRLGLTLFRSTISAGDREVGEIVFYGT